MSSVSPLGSQPFEVSGLTPATGASAPPAPYLQGTLDGVANMLGMSTPDLRSALKQGSSISDIATSKGVDRNSIVSYIEQQVQQQRSAQGKQPIDAQTLADVVNRAIDRHRHGHHGHAPAVQTAATTADQQPQPSSSSIDLLA